MTTMSQAALPPIQPRISQQDEAHPFPLYRQHLSFCSNNLITASCVPRLAVSVRARAAESEDRGRPRVSGIPSVDARRARRRPELLPDA